MDKQIDKLGELFIEYDDILNDYNIKKICDAYLENNNKLMNLVEIMIKKYKNNLSNELLNYFILNIFIIHDKNSQIKNKDKCLNALEKVIDDYCDSINNNNMKIFINLIIDIHKK
jgi:hypothetical protein